MVIPRRHWKQWKCKILGVRQGSLWSLWKQWMKLKMCCEPRRGLLVFYQHYSHHLVGLNSSRQPYTVCIWLYSGTPFIRSPMAQKNLAVFKRVFFYKKMNGGFSQATKKSGRTNEVIVRRGFIVFFTWVTCLPPNLGGKISLQKLPKFFGWPKRIKCVYPEILFQSLA